MLVEGAACQRLAVPGDSCGVKIQSAATIGTNTEIVLSCASIGEYFLSPVVYDVKLKTETAENQIWRNYEMGPISVSIIIVGYRFYRIWCSGYVTTFLLGYYMSAI